MDFRSMRGRAFLLALLLSTAVAGCGKKDAGDDAVSSSGSSTSGGTGSSGTGSESRSAGTGEADTSSGAGAAGTGGASAVGAAIDDSVITTKLKTAILADTTLKGSDISVETRAGEVQLTGSVTSAAQKDHAAKIAQALNGVKKVDNKLAVKK